MKVNIVILIIFFLLLPFIIGCATIMRGYEDEVRVQNAPIGLRIFTKDSVEIPVLKRTIKVVKQTGFTDKYENKEVQEIHLRKNVDQVLILKFQGKEKRLYAYPKINTGWFILDAILVLPLGVDAYTGNWNSFDDIDGSFQE